MFPSGQFWCPHVPNSKRSREEGGSSDGARDGGKVGRKEGRKEEDGGEGRKEKEGCKELEMEPRLQRSE